jgi:hypothetical protein
MLRAASWTVGLFALAGGVIQLFPQPYIEPLVLLALGATLLVVSGRSVVAARVEENASSARPPAATTRAAR